MTLYRTGISSVMVDILEEAARRGKEVTAIVELKARFDEEANINLAERLEAVGAQVVYGVLGLKTHGKMTLVLRREEVRGRPTLVRYAHLGTGNYHSATTKLYTDFGMLTSNAEICGDMEKAFMHMTSLTKVERLKHLWMAPFTLHRNLLRALTNEVKIAKSGKQAQVVAKMNALTDEATITALYGASQAGVKIDLIVRGACALRAGVKGLSENIRVRSIVGQFLELTAYYFPPRHPSLSVERRLDGPHLFRRLRSHGGARPKCAKRGRRGPDPLSARTRDAGPRGGGEYRGRRWDQARGQHSANC